MKKLLFMLMALAMAAVSCQKENNFDYSGDDAISHTISVGVPELDASRADAATGLNSGLGAIDNYDLNASLWEEYDLRYILEIYDVTEGYVNKKTPIRGREIKTLDRYEPTSFDVRLVPNRDYRFVVWADFVAEGTNGDLRYNTSDLNNIMRKGIAAMDESYDAYFIAKDFRIGESGLNESLTLKRPFGKIRVITTDLNHLNIGSEVDKVTVKFYDNMLYTSLDAVTGVAQGQALNEYVEYTVAKASPYTEGYDADSRNMTLFADYIFAGDESKGAEEVHFEMTTWGKDGRQISTRKFESQIPLERNKLTTIIGTMLTIGSTMEILVDDNFSGEYVNNTEKDSVAIAGWGFGKLNENNNYEFAVNDGANVFTVAVDAEAIENGALKAGLYTFVAEEAKLAADNFTVEGLKVDGAEAIVRIGNMSVEKSAEGTEVELSLYYVANAEDTVSENIVLCYTTDKDIAVQKAIAMPVVESAVEGNVVTLSWATVDGAAQYSVACNGEELETVETTTYEFEGEYETVYTFVVVAMPKDQEANIPSEGTEVVVTTEAAPVVEPEDVTATITFDNTSKRTTFTTSQQVWEENGIVVTNDKSSSSSAVADYVKPARFYKGSKITVDAPGDIVSIVFDCNSSSYATALKNSIKTGTVSVSSDKVTVTLSEAVENYVIESLTGGQVRMDSITVTYL
jgi:hypothetical protein